MKKERRNIKRYLLAALIGSLSATAGATCQYPLDATDAQYEALHYTRFPDIGLQSAGFTVIPGNYGYWAFSNAAIQSGMDIQAGLRASLGDITLPTSGVVALELSVDHFPPSSGALPPPQPISADYSDLRADIAIFGATYIDGQNDPDRFAVSANFWSGSEGDGYYAVTFIVSTLKNGVPKQVDGMLPLPQPLPAGYRVGLYLNMDTRQIGATMNGVDLGYAREADGTPLTIPASVQSALIFGFGENLVSSSTAPNVGQTVGFSLVTDKSQFTQPFPAGANDICSTNGGNGVLLLPNGKPYPGKGNPPGLLKMQGLISQGLRVPHQKK